MGILDLFRSFKNKEANLSDLNQWWLNDFNREERKYIVGLYMPMGSQINEISVSSINVRYKNEVRFLTNLSDWVDKPESRDLAKKIIFKAYSLENRKLDILDKHFLYQSAIKILYKDRSNTSSYNLAVEACLKQISISNLAKRAFKREYRGERLPSHTGFKQLCIIREKDKEYKEAITLCKQAKREGWYGDWDKRIERCQKKII